jgi:hypothetical protein
MSAAAGSGLLMPTLDEIMAAGRARSGVTAVLDAADRVRDGHYETCPCGALLQIGGALSGPDWMAIEEWHAAHADCAVTP